jgi:hypothetical protein
MDRRRESEGGGNQCEDEVGVKMEVRREKQIATDGTP